jgi:hypothetical protein
MVVEKPTCEMKVIDAKETAASTDFAYQVRFE